MATPNEPEKKPGGQPNKGPAPGKPAAGPGKPQANGPTKPQPGKLVGSGDKPAPKPGADKGDKADKGKAPAAKPVKIAVSRSTGGRKIGQVLVDLGYVDDDQLWELLDEAKNTNAPVGQVALNRGL